MITLYHAPRSRSSRIIWLLEELGVPYELVSMPFDHKYLNEEVFEFSEHVPTTENICIEIFNRLREFPRAKLERVRVEETSLNSFEYMGETGAVHE